MIEKNTRSNSAVSVDNQHIGHKVFSLKDVPEKEANGVRQVLAQSKIKFYETPSTIITDGALWVYEETDITNAIRLIDKFEVEWQRTNTETKLTSSKNTWKIIIYNLLLWSVIAVILIFIFGTFTSP
jgi:hypothetical protein